MLTESFDTIQLLRFKLFGSGAGFSHAVSMRRGPDDDNSLFDLGWKPGDDPEAAGQRIASVAEALGFSADSVCCANQVHGSSVCCIDEVPALDPAAPCRVCGEHDALVTNRPDICLLIRVADCVPIILFDPVRRVVAAVHAGWKGTRADIAGKTIACMHTHYGCTPSDILAGIGPSIGRCCFSVDDGVADLFRKCDFAAGCVHATGIGTTIDLPGANRAALLRSGLMPDTIEMSGCCTACNLDIFFSHRGEQGNTGRFGLFAGLRA